MSALVTVKGSGLRVGDRLDFLGHLHTIDRIEPYGPTNMPQIITSDVVVARSGPTWGMTVFPAGDYRIWPRVQDGAR
jgi:hypothetical protein